MGLLMTQQPKSFKFSDEVESRLRNSNNKFIVTGGSGWIGRATIAMLLDSLGESFHERTEVFTSDGRTLRIGSQLVETRPLKTIAAYKAKNAYLVHLAFLTKEIANELLIDDYISKNLAISDLVTSFIKNNEIIGAFIPSSGAVYKTNGDLEDNVQNNPYGYLKLQDEQRFFGLDIDKSRMAQIRVFNLAGPFMNKVRNYALGSIISDIYSGGPIRLTSNKPVLRSYVHVLDLLELSFQIMLGITQGPSVPFDTATEQIIEIGLLAEKCRSILQVYGIEIIRSEFDPALKTDNYVGSNTTFLTLAARAGINLATIEQQIFDTASWISSTTPKRAG